MITVTAPGCAWLLPSESVESVRTSHVEAFARSVAIANSEENVFAVDIDGLVAHARAWRQQRCLVESGRRLERQRVLEQRTSPWAWLAWAGEAATAGALSLVASRTWHAAGLALAIPTAVDLGLLARRGSHREVEPLPVDEQLDHSESVACQREPRRQLAITFRGDRGQVVVATDTAGQVELALNTLPRNMFPYQWPLATASYTAGTGQPVAPTPEHAATLVIARGELDDFDSWLMLHADTARAAQVQRARAQLVARLTAEQEALRQKAQTFRNQGDLLRAAAEARACEQVCRLPAPACTALYGEIVDTFVLQQRTLALQAAARGDLPTIEAALYRCQLMDPQRPACRHIEQAALEVRLAPVLARGAAALQLQQFDSVRKVVAQCHALARDAPVCGDLNGRLEQAEQAWKTSQAARLAQAGSKAWGRKQRRLACSKALQCSELDPHQAACSRLLQQCDRAGLRAPAPPTPPP